MVTCRQNKTKMYTALYGVKYLFPTYLKYGIRYDSCNTYIYLQLECILIFITYLINSCHTFTFQLLDKSWSLVSPLLPRFLPSIFIAHRVQQSHCSSIFHRLLLTHALALSASQLVHRKKSRRTYTSVHSAGLELTKLTYTNLIRHRGDRLSYIERFVRQEIGIGWTGACPAVTTDMIMRVNCEKTTTTTTTTTTNNNNNNNSNNKNNNSTHDAYENTWKCGELLIKLYFSPSARG